MLDESLGKEALNYIVNRCYDLDSDYEVIEAVRNDLFLSRRTKKQISNNSGVYKELARRVLVILSLTKAYFEELNNANEQLEEKEKTISALNKYIEANIEKKPLESNENVDKKYKIKIGDKFFSYNKNIGDEFKSIFTEEEICLINPGLMQYAVEVTDD